MLIFKSPELETTTTTVHRGITYDVKVNGIIPLSSLSLETVFSCSMEIPGTQFSLEKDTMYMHRYYGFRDICVTWHSDIVQGGIKWVTCHRYQSKYDIHTWVPYCCLDYTGESFETYIFFQKWTFWYKLDLKNESNKKR